MESGRFETAWSPEFAKLRKAWFGSADLVRGDLYADSLLPVVLATRLPQTRLVVSHARAVIEWLNLPEPRLSDALLKAT